MNYAKIIFLIIQQNTLALLFDVGERGRGRFRVAYRVPIPNHDFKSEIAQTEYN